MANPFTSLLMPLVDVGKDIFDDLHTSEEEKATIRARLVDAQNKKLQTITAGLQSRFAMVTKIIQAENASGDNYTKRARPTLVYFGMVVIFINHCLVPGIQSVVGVTVAPFMLPTEFWVAWGGTVAVWSAGRSVERVRAKPDDENDNAMDKVLGMISG